MGLILNTVAAALTEDDWDFDADEDREIIRTGVTAKNASYRMIFDAREDTEQLLLYLLCAYQVPDDRRLAAAEFMARANFGLVLGNFELDMEDGEVRYRVSIDIEGGELTNKMVRNMIGAGVVTLDRYFPGLMAVCYADRDPKEAVTEVEAEEDED